MGNSKVTHKLLEHINKNLIVYLVTILFLCIGIVIGIYSVKYMGDVERNQLISYLNGSFQNITLLEGNNKYVLFEAIKNNLFTVLVIWFLGLSMLGIPLILVIDLFKGFTIGFTSSIVINGLGSKGILINLLTIFPQNIIYIFCIIISSVISMEFSFTLLKSNSLKSINNTNTNLAQIVSYSILFMFIIVVMFIGILLEVYVLPDILNLVSYNGSIV